MLGNLLSPKYNEYRWLFFREKKQPEREVSIYLNLALKLNMIYLHIPYVFRKIFAAVFSLSSWRAVTKHMQMHIESYGY